MGARATARNISVKPVLSGHRIKRTPSIKRTVGEVPKFISLIYSETCIKRGTLGECRSVRLMQGVRLIQASIDNVI